MAPGVNREFLERSIEDLDREYLAGDLTERDHRRLREDYERRLRGEAPPPRPPARPGFVAASVAFVLVVAVAAGVLVARFSGRRLEGATITGGAQVTATAPAATGDGPTTTLPEALAACRAASGGQAIECYTSYTEANPEDPRGWVQFALFAVNAGTQSGSTELFEAGETFLERALELDPADVEARVYLAVLLDRTGRAEDAATECTRLAGAEVRPELADLVALACG